MLKLFSLTLVVVGADLLLNSLMPILGSDDSNTNEAS
jgi:hypothetical protein